MVGRRKLRDTSMNRNFNALSIGVQYTLSFHWLILARIAYHKENIVNFCWTEGRENRYRIQTSHNFFTKSWADKFEEKPQKFRPKAKALLLPPRSG